MLFIRLNSCVGAMQSSTRNLKGCQSIRSKFAEKIGPRVGFQLLLSFFANYQTRMHSSRMCTVRCSGRPWRGKGVCMPGGCLPARGSACQGGLPAGGSACQGGVSACNNPPVDRMTDTCKNITLPPLRRGQ